METPSLQRNRHVRPPHGDGNIIMWIAAIVLFIAVAGYLIDGIMVLAG
jgi:hypothetical protein